MNKMTVAGVITLIESFKAVCGKNSKAGQICDDAIELLEQQQQQLLDLSACNAAMCETVKQQQEEIKRLQAREFRLTEYMQDVKNYAFTLREVAQNAIDEGDTK